MEPLGKISKRYVENLTIKKTCGYYKCVMTLVLYYMMKFLFLRYVTDFKKYREEKGLSISFSLTIHDCFLPPLTSLLKRQTGYKSLCLDIDGLVGTKRVFSLTWDESRWWMACGRHK